LFNLSADYVLDWMTMIFPWRKKLLSDFCAR